MNIQIRGVYIITNNITKQIYIGSTSNGKGFENRWNLGYKNNRYLMAAFKKYGKENFSFEIIWRCEPKDCLYFEQLYLDYYEPWAETEKGYNICRTAGSSYGLKRSEETKAKMSLALKGLKKKPLTEEHKRKISIFHKNRRKPTRTEEAKINARKAHQKYAKRIISINVYTNEVIKYNSLREAERNGFNRQFIKDCCKKNKRNIYENCKWEYES